MAKLKGKKNTGDKANVMGKRLRHSVETQVLVDMNDSLTPLQKKRLRNTPFKWLIDLKERVKISGVLMREIVSRWDVHSKGVRVGNRIISFTELDVSVGLGLPIIGDRVIFDDGNDSRVKQLFKGGVITVSSIVDKMRELTKDDDVQDFCRLYILLAFKTFYFPQTTKAVHTLPFRLLNNLGMLFRYNWGCEVYRFLVSSLERVAPRLNEGKNKEALHIAGCAALLQTWTADHLSLRPCSRNMNFPRFLHWIDVGSGKCIVSKIFDPKKVVEELNINYEHGGNEVVNGAVGEEVKGDCQSISYKQKEIGNRISLMEDEMKVLQKLDLQRPSTNNDIDRSMKVQEPSSSVQVGPVRTTEKEKKNNKDLENLYQYCVRRMTRSMGTGNDTLVSIGPQYLNKENLKSMRPLTWVDNMVLVFACQMMMEEEFQRNRVITRFLFNPFFADSVVRELASFRNGTQKRWRLGDFFEYHALMASPIDILRSCNMIFAPALFKDHWVCYVLIPQQRKMHVLDSLHNKRNEDWSLLDIAMRTRFEELLCFMNEGDIFNNRLEIVCENMPKQHNNHDCGVYVLKYLELWNGENTMPNYSQGDILQFRREFVWKWVLDERNKFKKKVLADARVPADLMYV